MLLVLEKDISAGGLYPIPIDFALLHEMLRTAPFINFMNAGVYKEIMVFAVLKENSLYNLIPAPLF